ncbi:phosphoenolpyruvate-protein phosphotransferase PtsP, partial [Klebsiella pneumoniae]|nr:phosphoenolpyruvate-protein phosphotransferase PtsP [Klebsiella pneumoniae]
AVLQALMLIARACKEAGKPMSVCGEMAGDPAAAVLLLAMGCDVLSMNATNVPRVKWLLRQIRLSDAQALLNEALTLDNAYLV